MIAWNRMLAAAGIAAVLLVSGCGGSPQEVSPPAALLAQSAELPQAASVVTRQFVNGNYIETDANSVPGQVYRLYRAILGRDPDAEGLGYHTGQIEVFGHTLVEVAANFMASPEFVATYGALGNGEFVTLLYSNVLSRVPDPGGLKFWTDHLNAGLTRAEVVLGFSESDEFKTDSAHQGYNATTLAAGLVFKSYPSSRVYLTDGSFVETDPEGNAAKVFRLYQAAFGRVAEPDGLGFQVGQIEVAGANMFNLATNFMASPEFSTKYCNGGPCNALTNAQFVDNLYQNVLHRPGEESGRQFWLTAMTNGAPRVQVLASFAESDENKRNTLGAISAGIHFKPWPNPPNTPAIDPLAPLPPLQIEQLIGAIGVLPEGVGGDGGGDGGAAGGAGDGTPLRSATVTLVDSLGHTVSGTTDSNGLYVLKFNTATFIAPYVVKVIDANGNVLASTTAEQPATGKFVYININPLTDKITSDVLDPSIGGTDKVFDGSAIDTTKLAQAKTDLVTSISSALTQAGVVNVAGFDPVTTQYTQNGSGADAVVDSISLVRDPVSGATQLQAKLAGITYNTDGSPVSTLITAQAPLSTSLVATYDTPSLTYDKLNRWVTAVNRCLALANSDNDPTCQAADQNYILTPTYRNSSQRFDEQFRLIFSLSGGGHVQGAAFRNPVILFTGRSADDAYDVAVVEFTVKQSGTGPLAGNIATTLEYPATIVFKRDDAITTAAAGNWLAHGNQRRFNDSVQTRYLKSKEVNPLRAGNTVSGFADTYQTRLQLNFRNAVYDWNADNGTYIDSGVHAVRFTGPGLPAAGVVLVRSATTGAGSLAIHNKTGTIPPVGTTVNTASNSFGLAAVAWDGSALAGGSSYSTSSSVNSTTSPDFSTLGAYARYKMEIFLTTNTAGTTPDFIEYTRNLAAAQPPTVMAGFPFHDPTPSTAKVTPVQASSQSVLVQWANNLNTGPVTSAQISANERNPKGATSSFTTLTWDYTVGVFGAYVVTNRPTSQLITSTSTAFPSLTTAAGDFRQAAVWNTHSRALVQNVLRWDN